MAMTIKEFLNFAKDCKTKPELASLAKSNGLNLTKEELDRLFQKISEGKELSSDELDAATGGNVYGMSDQLKQNLIN